MSAGSDFILKNFKSERILQKSAYSCTELVMHDGIPYVRKTINAIGLPYAELKNISHPTLPHIFYAVEDEGRTYVIEEYISGRTLKECLEQNISFNQKQQKNIALQLCKVLEVLHKKGILHRDIKPSNIILMHDLQQVKLIDFGIGRSFANCSETESQDTCIMGTPGYAPPEQYGFSSTDQRSDIYALGKTLLELQNYEADSDYTEILRKCTEFDPNKRYQNVAELYFALEEKDRFLSKKHILYVVVLLVLMASGYYFFNRRSTPDNNIPVKQERLKEEKSEKTPVKEDKTQETTNAPAIKTETTQDIKQNVIGPANNNKETSKIKKNPEEAPLGAVKLRQIGHQLFFNKKTLEQVKEERELIFNFKALKNNPPLITVENISDYPAENAYVKLELYSFGMKASDFTHNVDASHTEKFKVLYKDRFGIARRVIIYLDGTIPPHTKYTFSALQQVSDFYMFYRGDHGTILGELKCSNMIPQSIGYTFNLK